MTSPRSAISWGVSGNNYLAFPGYWLTCSCFCWSAPGVLRMPYAVSEYRDCYQPIDTLAGPGRPFRFVAGAGGHPVPDPCGENCQFDPYSCTGHDAPGGGGVIVIIAPEIVFGASGSIEARGQDGYDAEPTGNSMDSHLFASGGGGGGTVELHTRVPLSAGDKAKVSASGGAGVANKSLTGLDGVTWFCGLEKS